MSFKKSILIPGIFLLSLVFFYIGKQYESLVVHTWDSGIVYGFTIGFSRMLEIVSSLMISLSWNPKKSDNQIPKSRRRKS